MVAGLHPHLPVILSTTIAALFGIEVPRGSWEELEGMLKGRRDCRRRAVLLPFAGLKPR